MEIKNLKLSKLEQRDCQSPIGEIKSIYDPIKHLISPGIDIDKGMANEFQACVQNK